MPIRWYQLRRAALEADAFWTFIVGIVLSAPVSYLMIKLTNPNLATQFKYAGVLLETFGFGLVAMGIEQTRAQFGQPSTVALFRSWVRLIASSFGRRRPETHNLKIDAAAHGHISTGDVTVILGAPKDAPLEKRIDVLEQKLSRLREDTEKKAAQLSDRISEVNQTVMAHKAQWDTEQQGTRQQIEQFAVGGLRYEIVGLAWLLFGTLFSNLNDEFARMFGPLLNRF